MHSACHSYSKFEGLSGDVDAKAIDAEPNLKPDVMGMVIEDDAEGAATATDGGAE